MADVPMFRRKNSDSEYLISNMCMRVVINKSIQYKIIEFAMGAINSIEYIRWCHFMCKIRTEPGVLSTNVRCNLQVVHIIPLSCKKRTNTLDFHFLKFISTSTCTDACAITAMLKNVRMFVDNGTGRDKTLNNNAIT